MNSLASFLKLHKLKDLVNIVKSKESNNNSTSNTGSNKDINDINDEVFNYSSNENFFYHHIKDFSFTSLCHLNNKEDNNDGDYYDNNDNKEFNSNIKYTNYTKNNIFGIISDIYNMITSFLLYVKGLIFTCFSNSVVYNILVFKYKLTIIYFILVITVILQYYNIAVIVSLSLILLFLLYIIYYQSYFISYLTLIEKTLFNTIDPIILSVTNTFYYYKSSSIYSPQYSDNNSFNNISLSSVFAFTITSYEFFFNFIALLLPGIVSILVLHISENREYSFMTVSSSNIFTFIILYLLFIIVL